MDEITPETIASFLAGDLTDAEARELRERAEADPAIAEQISAFGSLTAFLREETSIALSSDAIKSAKRLLASSRPGLVGRLADRATDGLRVFLAALDFDSRLTPSVAGYRGVAEITQVAFSCDVCEIDIEIQRGESGRSTLRAQIDADKPGAWSVALRGADSEAIASVQSDQQGALQVELPDGVFTMVLERSGVRVEAGPLAIP